MTAVRHPGPPICSQFSPYHSHLTRAGTPPYFERIAGFKKANTSGSKACTPTCRVLLVRVITSQPDTQLLLPIVNVFRLPISSPCTFHIAWINSVHGHQPTKAGSLSPRQHDCPSPLWSRPRTCRSLPRRGSRWTPSNWRQSRDEGRVDHWRPHSASSRGYQT